jgi:hypothetical protein
MADVKGFGNVGRRVLDDNGLPSAGGVRAVPRFTAGCELGEFVNLGQNFTDEIRGIELEMKERLVVCYRRDVFVWRKLCAIEEISTCHNDGTME